VLLALFSTGSTVQAQIPELVIGIGTDADTLNPQEQTTSLMINMCELLYDTLFYQNPEDKIEPRLATKVDVSKDGLTFTLHLRKDVKFSDGTPFDAKVMKLTVDRALDPKMSVPQRSQINMIKESKIVDDYTIELVLSYPFAPFMPTLSMFILSPISPAAIQKYGQDVRQNPVGAGPYVLKEWVKGDRSSLPVTQPTMGRNRRLKN
jgi:ABC-type transport system substrate-binding protein